jgi:hypothetical protein
MKLEFISRPNPNFISLLFWSVASLAFLSSGATAHASIAYGSINNFDTVNDTGVPCHGFEIELDDLHSVDITYTYDWNHYGTPKMSEDFVVSGTWHTNVHVRYEAAPFSCLPSASPPATPH